MKNKYYSTRLSNSIDFYQDIISTASTLQERELKEIFDTHYNDIFPKILSKEKTDFISLLKEKVSLHLKIINKITSNSSISKYLDIFTKKYINDKTKVTKGFEEITKTEILQEKYLDILSCYIHCCKCSQILHKCKNKIIYYKNYIYCIHCQKVYNENQIKLYCPECQTIYYTKLRYVLNKKYQYFYPVAFKQYHCPTDEQQKIKCLECGNDLYYDIMCEENKIRRNTVKEIFCLKCKFLYNMDEVSFTCKICKEDFNSEAVFYNNFSLIRQQILLLVNTLHKGKHALPDINYNRKCKCNISNCDKYLHVSDNGTLYLGTNLEGQLIIICSECYTVFKYNDFIWNCPLCKVNFKSKKIYSKEDYQKILKDFGERKYSKRGNICKSPSHEIINNKKPSKDLPKIRMRVNLSNIAKDFYKNNDTDKYKTYVFENNERNKKAVNKITSKNSLNSMDQKKLIYKKLQKENNEKNYKNYNILNETNAEINYRLKNFLDNTKTDKKVSSYFSNFSFNNNNKSETNSNKEFIENKESNESTTHITSRNNKSTSLNDFNVFLCNCPNCIIENEIKKKYYYNYNNRINKKLLYDDFFEKDNKNNNNNIYVINKNKENNYKLIKVNHAGNNSKKNNLLKSKTIIEEDNSLNKKNKRKQIRPTNTKVDLTKTSNNAIKGYNLKKKMKSSQNFKRIESREKIIKVELRDNTKSAESRNNIKIIEPRERIYSECKDCLKSLELNIQEKKYLSKNHSKEIKINENKFCKTDKKPKENIKCFIFRKGKINNNKIERKKLNLSLLSNIYSNNLLDSAEINNYKNNNTESNEKNFISKINLEHDSKIKNMKNNVQNKIDEKKEKKINIQEKKSQRKILNNFRNNNIYKNNLIKVNRYNSKKDKKEDSNLVFSKLKKYYEDCVCDECEKNLLLNSTNFGSKIMQLSEKKSKFKSDFNSDDYTIIKLLGKGTYGKTYLVEDSKTKERFALKKIIINDKFELKDNEDEFNFILRLNKEYPDLKVINIYGIEHKNLDKYTTVMYVLMEAANSDWEKELLTRCESKLYYTESQLVQILSNLVWTFAALQKKGISHRDIKPQNILCFDNNEYKISDFGEAKKIQNICIVNKRNSKYSYSYQDNTMKQTLRGTELYMSPVLFLSLTSRPYKIVKHNTFKSDVFSLGMCFFLASSLDYDGLYEVREIIKNPSKTKLVINRYLSKRYSQKYINLLISMLQINEKDRPDFIELEKTIENLKF